MTKGPAVQSSGASLSMPAGSGGGLSSNRAAVARAASSSRLGTRTIIETAACPPELKHGDQPWSFSEFRVQKMLGEGGMSSVVHCVCSRTGCHTAIKMYHRDRMNAMNVKQVSREIEIHASLLHPNIVRLYAAFEDADGIYLVQEYAARGDLYVELSRRGGYMAEAHVVKGVMIPFLSALTYMHAQGILHRDIKPENIMLSAEGEVKVGDFGLAINTTRERPMSRVGTLDYMAPEIVRLPYGGSATSAAQAAKPGASDAAYGLPVDVWCCGVLAHELLLGSPPFEAESKEATYTRILKLEPALPSHLSEPARDFIRAALNKDAARRPTMHQLLRHSWLRAYQRPKSMIVLESPSLSRPGTAAAGHAPAAVPADRTAAAAAAAAMFAAVQHIEEQGEAVVATGPSITGPPSAPASGPASPVVTVTATAKPAAASPAAAAALGSAARAPHMSKSLSFSSTMAGRFSAVKPSKPSAFSMLLRYKGGSGKAEGSLRGSSSSNVGSSFAAGGRAEEAAAAAVAQVEAERAAAAAAAAAAVALVPGGGSQSGGKAGAADRLVIRVQATSGSAAAAPADSTAPSGAALSAGAPGDDLIRAALPDGSRITRRTTTSTPRGSSGGSRTSFAAAIKRKLSSAGSKGISLFVPAPAAETAKDESSAVALAAAASAATGRGAGAGCISAVQAPSMQQLLASPVVGSKAGKQKRNSASSSRLQALAMGFGKKLSFKGSAGQAGVGGAEETSSPPRRTASRLSAAAS